MKSASKIECDPRQAVVRVVPFRFEFDDGSNLVRLAVVVGVAQTVNIFSSGDIQRSITMKIDVHDIHEALVKDRSLIGAAVAIGVFEDQDAVRLRSVIVVWTKVRMTLSNEHPAAIVDS